MKRLLPWLALAALSCEGAGSEAVALDDYEGVDPGECTDGADNDRNGYFDCRDNGCMFSPDCEGDADADADADGDADADADADGDADTDIGPLFAHLTDFELRYDVAFDLTPDGILADTMCSTYGICDCEMAFAADGTQVEAVGARVTMHGKWERVENNCDPSFEAIWLSPTNEAYHSFNFEADGSRLNQWVVHAQQIDYDPLDNPMDNEQFYITEIRETWTPTTLTMDYEETESEPISPLVLITTSEIDLDFNVITSR